MEEESSSDSGSSNGDEAAEEIEEDEMAMDMAQVIDTSCNISNILIIHDENHYV